MKALRRTICQPSNAHNIVACFMHRTIIIGAISSMQPTKELSTLNTIRDEAKEKPTPFRGALFPSSQHWMNYESSASHRSYHFLLSRSPLASCWLSLQCVRKKKSLLTMCSFFIFLSNSVSPWQCSYTSTFSFGCTRISLGNSVFFSSFTYSALQLACYCQHWTEDAWFCMEKEQFATQRRMRAVHANECSIPCRMTDRRRDLSSKHRCRTWDV